MSVSFVKNVVVTCLSILALCSVTFAQMGDNVVNTYRPVMLRYIAREYNCSLICDEENKKVSIVDKNGFVIKTYYDVAYFYDEPIIDALTLEFDLGWTLCKHLPDTDMFDTELQAVIAGWCAFLLQSENSQFTYFVGRCYTGYYFSLQQNDHENICAFKNIVFDDIHSCNSVTIENGQIMSYNINSKPISSWSKNNIVFEQFDIESLNSGNASVFDESVRPLLLKYIIQKNKGSLKHNEKDNKTSIFNNSGDIIMNYKNVPIIGGEFVVNAGSLERDFGWDNCSHEANIDRFESEKEAILAGFFTYFKQSEDNKFTFFVGSCYDGHYFSLIEGEHEKYCKFYSVLDHMHNEISIDIENGFINYENEKHNLNTDFQNYINDKNLSIDKPPKSLTKMVTVFHTEYAKKEGVQSNYYSYRDRVYRNYWEDLANYDATDYIFIPPTFQNTDDISKSDKIKKYKQENQITIKDMTIAINSLLKYNKTAKVWIGTPKTLDYNADEAIDEAILDFFNKIKRELDDSVWQKNVVGMYLSQEAIFGDDKQQQIQLKRIKKIIDTFKMNDDTKKALWIPYYEQSAGKIAKVVQTEDLFDYIIIQPSYFNFNGLDPIETKDKRANVQAVKLSAQNNYITTYLGEAVNKEYSNTQIGMELEAQLSYFSYSRDTREESFNRHIDYLMAATKIMEYSPTAYYSPGEPHCNMKWMIYKFYETDKLNGSYAVKKRLKEGINSYYDYVFETREKEKVFSDYAKELFLAANADNTDELFMKTYKADLVIPAFYRFEKANKIEDLANYLNENKSLPEYFNKRILNLLLSY